MKKFIHKFISVLAVSCCLHSLQLQAGQNILIIQNATTEPGITASINIEITNEDPFVAFQVDIPLEQGFGHTTNASTLSPRSNGHFINSSILPGSNLLRIIAFSLYNTPFLGNSGVVATFSLTVPETPGTYPLVPTGTVISNAVGGQILTGTVNGTLIISGYTVTFNVFDQLQVPVQGASITLGSTANPPGEYVFAGVNPGTWPFAIVKDNYYSVSGSVVVVNQHVDVNVVCEFMGTNMFIIPDVSGVPGENIVIGLEVQNQNSFVAFQLDNPIPAGFSYINGSASLDPARITDHEMQASLLPGTNIFRMIAYSFTNAAFLGNSGTIATFALTTPAVPGSHALTIDNGVLSNKQGLNVMSGVSYGTINLILNPPAFFINPTGKDFGTVNINTQSPPQIFSVKNTGGGILNITYVQLRLNDIDQFILTDTNTYPAGLSGGDSLTFSVRFAPTSAGAKTVVLTVVDDLTKTMHNFTLTGTGFDPTLYLPFQEGFTGLSNNAIPEGWSRSHTNWGVQASTNAGGVAPEMRFDWIPVLNTSIRLVTPGIFFDAGSNINLSFKHRVDDFPNPPGGYTLKVESSADGGNTWVPRWTLQPNGSVPAQTINVNLNALSGDTCRIAWVFQGYTPNINNWFLDDILIEATPITIVPGDANCDGQVNLLDIITLANYIMGSNPPNFCFENADVNGDGMINLIDIIGTANIIGSGG